MRATTQRAARPRPPSWLLCAVAALFGGPGSAQDGEPAGFPALPPPGEHLVDRARLLESLDPELRAAALARVADTCAALEAEGARVILVTRGAGGAGGADGGAGEWSASAYARALFERWCGGDPAPVPALSRETSVVVVLAADERRVALAHGSRYLSREPHARLVEEVFAYHLDRGNIDDALSGGVDAVASFVRGRAVSVPGGRGAAWAFAVAFILVVLSSIDFLRKGPTCVSYRAWSSLFSVLGALITWALSRGVEIGATLSGRGARDTSSKSGVVISRW